MPEQTAEKKNMILNKHPSAHPHPNNRKREKNIPHGNTQPPNALRLNTDPLTGSNPAPIVHLLAQVPQIRVQMRGECIRRSAVVAVQAEDIADVAALEVGERLSQNHRDDDDGDEEEGVQRGGREEGEDVIEEEDCGDDCVDCCDACLDACQSSRFSPSVSRNRMEEREKEWRGRTIVIVPMKTPGG